MRFHRFAAASAAALALAAGVSPARSQGLSDDQIGGALLGAIAGGIIGNNSRHSNTWEGAAIGAGAGLLLGSVAGSARDRSTSTHVPVPVYSGSWDHHRYDACESPRWRSSHDRRAYRPNAGASGAVLGAIAGGVIGNNSRHSNTWEGAAIGAGAGFLLGSIVDNQRASDRWAHTRVERPPVYIQEVPPVSGSGWALPAGRVVTAAPVVPAASGQVVFGPGGELPPGTSITINNSTVIIGSPQSSANGLFGR